MLAGLAAATAAATAAVTVGPTGQVSTIAEALLRNSHAPYDLQGEVILQAGTFGATGNCGLNLTQNGGLTIRGAGRDATVVDCGGADRFAWVHSQGPFYLQDLTVRGGRADYGGALKLASVYAVLENVTFANNTATEQGGALWLWSGSFVGNAVDFDGNDAGSEGTAVWADSLYVRVNGGSWSGHAARTAPELYCANGAMDVYTADAAAAAAAHNLGTSCNNSCTITVRDENGEGEGVSDTQGDYQLCPVKHGNGVGAAPSLSPVVVAVAGAAAAAVVACGGSGGGTAAAARAAGR